MCLHNTNTKQKSSVAQQRSCVMGRSDEEEVILRWDQDALFPSCLAVSSRQLQPLLLT